jgi:hypothetical protein
MVAMHTSLRVRGRHVRIRLPGGRPLSGHAAWLYMLAAGCQPQPQDSETSARLATLETEVRQLEKQVRAANPNPPAGATGFDVACPAPWQALGKFGDADWTCRAPQALPSGWWPNCNVTSGPAQPGLSAKAYFDASLAAVPQLQAARRLSDTDGTLGATAAHVAIYEHDLLPKPLRVLATIAVHADRAYAVSCSAPPEAFAANEAMFRSVTQSFRWKP